MCVRAFVQFAGLRQVEGLLRITANQALTSLAFLSSLEIAGRCQIDPPELLENAPENVRRACGAS